MGEPEFGIVLKRLLDLQAGGGVIELPQLETAQLRFGFSHT